MWVMNRTDYLRIASNGQDSWLVFYCIIPNSYGYSDVELSMVIPLRSHGNNIEQLLFSKCRRLMKIILRIRFMFQVTGGIYSLDQCSPLPYVTEIL
jgi:hypothetical protein